MKEKTKNIVCLCILIIVPVILLVLCSTGYSFRKREEPEHFFSKITNYFSPKEIPKMDESVHVVPTSVGDSNSFPLEDDDDALLQKRKLPNMETDYNKYDLKDIDKNFKPKSTSVHTPSDDKNALQNNIQPSNMHKNVNNNEKDNMLDVKPLVAEQKDIPPINPAGPKVGPQDLEKSVDLANLISHDSFKFFDSNFIPDKDKYIYTGAEIGVDGDTPVNFKCYGGEEPIQAEAVAQVNEDGQVYDIRLVNKGKGYKKAKVTIEGGNGNGCKAKAVVDDNSTISHIEVLQGGHNYTSTPHVIISNPNQNKSCKLFFRKDKK